MSDERYSMTIELKGVTRAQAIALHAMFRLWRQLGMEGSSRYVGFFVDGDGNFRPDIEARFSADPYDGLTAEQIGTLHDEAEVHKKEPIMFDFDPVAWSLRALSEGDPNVR